MFLIRKIITGLGTSTLLIASACSAAAPTLDANAIYTQAAGTAMAEVASQQTETAAAMPPTATATETPGVTPSSSAMPTLDLALPTVNLALPTLDLAATSAVTPLVFPTALPNLTPTATPVSGLSGQVPGGWAVGCNNAVFYGESVPDGTKFKPGTEFKKSWSFLNAGTCTWDENYMFAFKSGDQMGGGNVIIKQKGDFTVPSKTQAFVIDLKAPIAPGTYTGYWQMKDDSGAWFGSLVSVKIVVEK